MRYLGYTLFVVAFAAILAANAKPAPEALVHTDRPSSQPHWTAAHAHQFPGCVGSGDFLPARIVVVARDGAAKVLPYTEATIARIDATWETPNAWDDLYTIGRCAR